jgi:hypothetical protein
MRPTIAARVFLFLLLALLWARNFPNHAISEFIGAHFPWPTQKSWKWSALLFEGTLIQLVATAPVAILLAFAFRAWAVRVALALSVIFVILTLPQLPSPLSPPYGTVFISYITICHVAFLSGITVVTSKRLTTRLAPLSPAPNDTGDAYDT